MTETARTAAYVAVAALLVAAAATWAPARKVPPVFDDQGTPFFPAFQDPVGTPEDPAVTAMEVVDFDEGTGTARPFKVEFRSGAWRIPSHHDYPADAKDRVAKTASGVVGLRKDRIVSDRPEDHGSLGVIDPLADAVLPMAGRGRRVTLRDKAGGVLADFIVGKSVDGAEGMRYVRLPDQKRTYAVKVDVDLSARFADWIETDLLRLDRWDLDEIVLDGYSVDENTGTIEPGEILTLRKKEGGSDWVLDGASAGGQVDQEKVRPLTETLDDLRIVGVRRKPDGVTKGLRAETGIRMDNRTLLSLQRAGYFVAADGKLVSNEGEVRVRMKDGILYTLRFGEVLLGTGDEVTAGAAEGAEGADGGKKEGSSAAGAENRYLFVTAAFDESALAKPEPPPEPSAAPAVEPSATGEGGGEAAAGDGEPAADPAANPPAPPTAGDDAAKKAREEYDRAVAERARKVEEGRKRAASLTDRFADWYYVISADSFRKLRLTRKDLVGHGSDGTIAEPPPPVEDEGGADGDTDPPPAPEDDGPR